MSFVAGYSPLDRALHHVAFSHPSIQRALAEIEDDLFKARIRETSSDREVFVSGLPRAGTTLVLDLLYRTGEFASFTYRQMPFILAPLLWNSISRSMQKRAEVKERAHGDGMEVSFDSPEAFEEVIWLTYLRDRIVGPHYLSPISADECSKEFGQAFRNCIRKLLSVGEQTPAGDGRGLRYLSKNNANVSRLDAIAKMCPTSIMIVPFRDPFGQASSLSRQHERFLKEHVQDRFSRRYMEWLGHYEFGESLRPINFAHWLDRENVPLQADQDFWVRYWIAAYTYVSERTSDRLLLLDYDELRRDAQSVLERLARRVALSDPSRLTALAGRLRAPTTKPLDPGGCTVGTRERAAELHAQLKRLAL